MGRPRWNGRGSAWAGGFYVALLKEIVVMITVSYVNYDYCEEVAWGIVMTGLASGLPDINSCRWRNGALLVPQPWCCCLGEYLFPKIRAA